MKKLFAILAAALITCGIMVAPAFADEANLDTEVIHEGAVFESESEAIEAMEAEEAEVPDTEAVVYEEVIQMDDKVVTDKEAWDETIEHPAVTHEETVVDEEAWDETIEHPAVTHEETVVDKEAWDETVIDKLAYDETVIDEPAYDETVIDKPAWDETIIDKPAWDETIEHPATWTKCSKDGQTSYTFGANDDLIIHDGQSGYWYWAEKPIANWKQKAAESGINKGDQVATARFGYGTFTFKNKTFIIEPGRISACGGISWVAWGGNGWTETIHHDAITHVVHHDAVTHVVHHEAVTHVVHHEAITHVVHHEAITHQETIIDKPAWEETIHHDAVTHQETIIDKPAWKETVHHDAITHQVEQWTYVFVTELNPTPVPPTPVPPAPVPDNTIVIHNNMTPAGQSTLPKTADEMISPAGTAFLILLVGLLVLALATPWIGKGKDEED